MYAVFYPVLNNIIKTYLTQKCMLNKVPEGWQGGSAVPRTVLAPLNGRRGEYPACIINFLTIDKPGAAGFVPGPQIKFFKHTFLPLQDIFNFIIFKNIMPTYEYECKSCSNTFEVFQSMSDPPLKDCPECGSEVRRLIFGGSGVIFKGSGFYVTDKGKGGKAAVPKKAEETSAGSGSKSTGSEVPKGDSAKSDHVKGDHAHGSSEKVKTETKSA
jgi:putative FmdB family regulatory protein